MSDGKIILNEDNLDKVVGGLFAFHSSSNTVDFTRPDGSVTTYKVNDMDNAFSTACLMEAKKTPEEDIYNELVKLGYIEG